MMGDGEKYDLRAEYAVSEKVRSLGYIRRPSTPSIPLYPSLTTIRPSNRSSTSRMSQDQDLNVNGYSPIVLTVCSTWRRHSQHSSESGTGPADAGAPVQIGHSTPVVALGGGATQTHSCSSFSMVLLMGMLNHIDRSEQ